MVDEYCAVRIVKEGDVNKVADRVALIEKTPRVRISKNKYGIEHPEGFGCVVQNMDAWLYGEKGNSEYGTNENSRAWCDNMLRLLGWE